MPNTPSGGGEHEMFTAQILQSFDFPSHHLYTYIQDTSNLSTNSQSHMPSRVRQVSVSNKRAANQFDYLCMQCTQTTQLLVPSQCFRMITAAKYVIPVVCSSLSLDIKSRFMMTTRRRMNQCIIDQGVQTLLRLCKAEKIIIFRHGNFSGLD